MVFLFAASLFAGSFLLFLVEPMAAKMVLPRLGGAPMVWNSCVLFFQGTLLAGYGLAYFAASRRRSGPPVAAFLVLLAVALIALPIAIPSRFADADSSHPVFLVVTMLSVGAGLPFLALSMSPSVLQAAFAHSGHTAAADPYFLYAASNAGSLAALLSYPLLIEPMVTLHDQARYWSVGYVGFVVLAATCASVTRLWRSSNTLNTHAGVQSAACREQSAGAHASGTRAVAWIAWSFIPSSLMLAVTSYLSTDVAAVPLLWIVPLTIYLLTFVLAFSTRGAGLRAVAVRRLPLLVLPIIALLSIKLDIPSGIAMPLHLLAFAMAALLCHTRLASSRPPRAVLTAFYFWIAVGGFLGGAFSTLLAPLIFTGISEYPVLLVLACLARVFDDWTISSGDVLVALGVGVLTLAVLSGTVAFGMPRSMLAAAVAFPLLAAFSQLRHPVRFSLAVAAMLLAGEAVVNPYGRVLHAERTFFGVYRVATDVSGRYHILFHGTTQHGQEALDPARAGEPLAYYHRTGPFGQAIAKLSQLSSEDQVAVVGLGVGSLAAYATGHQLWTFYELDPAIERLARRVDYFTFLESCGTRCRVVIGDARLSLEKAPQHAYRLIVLDAFSSDAIPIHLLTREALTLYLSRLADHGVLAFHVSNRHLTLAPVLARLAGDSGLAALRQLQIVTPAEEAVGAESSEWLLMARDVHDFRTLEQDARWTTPVAPEGTPLWTDDFSNILSAFHSSR